MSIIEEIKGEIKEVYNVHSLKEALIKSVEYLEHLNVAPTGAPLEGLEEILKILKKSQ